MNTEISYLYVSVYAGVLAVCWLLAVRGVDGFFGGRLALCRLMFVFPCVCGHECCGHAQGVSGWGG